MGKLFTTEDGVDIYRGDKYYSVSTEDYKTHPGLITFFKEKYNLDLPKMQHAGTIAGPYINSKATEPDSVLKYFYHKENAENFAKSFW